MSDTAARVGGVTIKREVGLGEIVVLLMALAALATFLLGGTGDTKILATRLDSLTAGVARVEGVVNALNGEVRPLQSIKDRQDAQAREIDDGKARDAAQDQRIDGLRQRVIEIGADVEGLKRASAVPLPGARR